MTKRTKKKQVQIPHDADGNVKLPLTVAQAAALWELSPSRVKVLIAQGRVKHEKLDAGARGTLLILQVEAPPDVPRGGLTPEQREATARIKAEKPRKLKKAS